MSKAGKRGGFTLVEMMIVVFIIGLLAAIAMPSFIRSRITSQTNVCINNLRQIDAAIQQWALDLKMNDNSTVQFSDISTYLKKSVTCPSGGASFADSYDISTVDETPLCQKVPSVHFLPDTEWKAKHGHGHDPED